MFPGLFTTQQYATQTLVLGSRPWPRGLFTLSARLVDGAGAGRCRMPGAVSVQVLAGRRAGRGWVPCRRRGQGSESGLSTVTQLQGPCSMAGCGKLLALWRWSHFKQRWRACAAEGDFYGHTNIGSGPVRSSQATRDAYMGGGRGIPSRGRSRSMRLLLRTLTGLHVRPGQG